MRIALGIAGLAVSAGAAFGMNTAHAEPDINCASGDFTGRGTSSPDFVRHYPEACVIKFLGLAHAENFSAPGGDTELVSLGKIACHSLDVDDSVRASGKAVVAAEPRLTFTHTSDSLFNDPGDELQHVAVKGLCP